MSRFRFYFEKIRFLVAFIWGRDWKLLQDEWNLTYKEAKESEKRFAEIEERALARLLRAVENSEVLVERHEKL